MKCLSEASRLLCIFFVIPLLISHSVCAQEFPSGGVFYLEGHQGLNTAFHGYDDAYVGGLQLRPQWTVVKGVLRLGATAGAAYSQAHVFGVFGPSLAVKVGDIPAGVFGTLGNFQLQAEHLWGTWHQRLLGGGFKIEAGFLMIGVTAHRDYGLNSWWFQLSTGYNLTRKKHSREPVDPMR